MITQTYLTMIALILGNDIAVRADDEEEANEKLAYVMAHVFFLVSVMRN